jgi:cytochrome c oxidase cbb3-type subunit 3
MNNPEEPQVPGDPSTTGHEYDGIKEFDNPTPGWWIFIFVITVAFSVCYGVYYHAPVPDRSVYDAYEADNAEYLKKKFGSMEELVVTDQNMLKWMNNADYMAIGKASFKQNCASCHGNEGQGIQCPNMTDDYYKDVKRLTDFPRVIGSGAGDGKMPAWSTRLHPKEVILVGAYVASLRGKNLPGPAEQTHLGDQLPPWPKLEASAASSAPATPPATAR